MIFLKILFLNSLPLQHNYLYFHQLSWYKFYDFALMFKNTYYKTLNLDLLVHSKESNTCNTCKSFPEGF